ncbi:SH2 domain-containing protein 4A isoform X2 [Scleropages formosus]|uniref:Zgc:100829 n=1 Tax=Scleropages formosus TaxID=113540 RepID=A0A8C9W962_SCLFO|nr:SH2 domain-containing protein 4A-like isoform X2 [Scleropages formosus]
MLQQILQDMYVDPDVLDALNEEQKKILFLKMRQEQVRRWKEREERLEKEATLALRPKPKKVLSKNVSWLLGRDGDVHVSVIGELDELDSSRGPRSGFGEKKPSSPRSNMWVPSESLRSNSVNRMLTEPVRTGRENLPPGTRDGIELSFRVLEKEQRPLSPVKDAEKVIDSGGIADPPKALGPSKGPQLRNVSKTSVTAKWDLLDSQERHLGPVVMRGKLCPQDSLDHRRVKGRDFRLGPASCRPDPDGEEGGPAVARGRVAALMKNFNVPSRSKPPVPSKPTHLQLLASPSLR